MKGPPWQSYNRLSLHFSSYCGMRSVNWQTVAIPLFLVSLPIKLVDRSTQDSLLPGSVTVAVEILLKTEKCTHAPESVIRRQSMSRPSPRFTVSEPQTGGNAFFIFFFLCVLLSCELINYNFMILLISKQIWVCSYVWCGSDSKTLTPVWLRLVFSAILSLLAQPSNIPIPMAYGHVRWARNNNECKLPQWTI